MRLAALAAGLLLPMMTHRFSGLFTSTVLLLFGAAGVAFGLMPWVIRLAWRIDAIDRPDARRVHAEPTPRIGGVAIFCAVNLTLLLNFDYSLALKGATISATVVACLSLWDDLRPLSAAVKLLVQSVALLFLMLCGIHADLGNSLWWWPLEFVITALWMIGITNAFNFLDGINGLAGWLAVVVSLLMGLLAWHTDQEYMLKLCFAVAGGALGFLPDNARYRAPARTFMGDVGSTYLGWIMAAIALMGDWSSEGVVKSYSAPLLIFSVMIFDMIYTTVARIARGDVRTLRQWIEYVGRDHLHHRLMDMGCSQAASVVMITAFTLLMGLAALAIIKSSLFATWLLLAQAVVFYGVLSFLMLQRR
ncbi:MAG: undecaprenyl/decaprenyl-phosphate alpha-N-acetylglucosaminyl 1-phosphate transferase [Zetaproteobacteria bacterium]|nr:MAG: undecaprenyl/decaprenyl-phosphate alpha-N-acetylglucosaminyl 1-phosphate transferase [Zetaproteobacteria bacterium]